MHEHGFQRTAASSCRHFHQHPCGCLYLVRDSNRQRREKGCEKIDLRLLIRGQDNDTRSE